MGNAGTSQGVVEKGSLGGNPPSSKRNKGLLAMGLTGRGGGGYS